MSDVPNEAETVLRRVFDLLQDGQAEQAVELLDPDIEWRNSGLPTVRGKRVHDMLTDMERRGIAFSATFHHIAAKGDASSGVVLTDRTDVLTYKRWSASFWVRGTYKVRTGKIVLWDDAFSWGDFVGSSLVGLAKSVGRRRRAH